VAIKDSQARKRYCTTVDEENVVLKRQLRQQTDVVKGLESTMVSLRTELEQANGKVKRQHDELRRAEKARAQAQSDGQIVAETLARDVDCLLSVSCRLQSEHLALQKLCASYETTIDQLHIGRHAPALRRSLDTLDQADADAQDGSSSAELRAASHPLGVGFNDPVPLAASAAPDDDAREHGGEDESGDVALPQAASPQGAVSEAAAADEERMQEGVQGAAARDSKLHATSGTRDPAAVC
jgi:hypothetical protein